MGFVEEIEQATATVADGVGPSVVRIGRHHGRGAGVVVADGAVLTNAHNVRGHETTVTFADGHRATGTVSGVDADGDLAVIAVDTAGAPAVTWRDDAVGVGAVLWSVTTVPGGGTRVTSGTVSAASRTFRGPRGRLIDAGLEHTAPLGRGSSGSPVVDAEGRLVGLNTHRLGEGFYLALPADADLRRRVDALTRGESPRRPYLGVAIAPSGAARRLRAAVGLPERDGVLVRGVDDDGPAARAGIVRGDLLVSAAGRPLTNADDLFAALDGLAEGASLELGIVRGTDEISVSVSFGEGGTEGSA